MPTYNYVARTRDGESSAGVISGKDVSDIREVLRRKDMFLVKVKQRAAPQQGSSLLNALKRRKPTLGDMVVMSRQLATLVKAGLPIVECLHSVAQQTEKVLLVEALQQVRLDVLTGANLSEAMARQPKIFNEMYVSLVAAGETGGVLEKTLEIAADQFDREADLREKVKSAFVYPILVLVACFGVITFMLLVIVPVFAKVYKEFKAELPAMTKLLVAMSGVFVHYWWMVILGTFAAVIFIRRYVRTPAGRKNWDRMKLRLPLFGKLIRKIAIARFTQTFAGVSKAGVPILRALSISANTSGNVILIEAIQGVANFVKEGATISIPMEQSGEFPPIVTRMVAAGEASGNLDEMLDEVTRFYQRDIEYSVERLTRLMEPIMTVLVGSIVLFVLLALYMPMFNLSNVIKR
jgi:type IV pilus assembly protein PilC